MSEPRPFRKIGGVFVAGQNAQASAARNDGLSEFVLITQHLIDQIPRLFQRVRIDFGRSHNRKAAGIKALGVHRGNTIGIRRVESNRLMQSHTLDRNLTEVVLTDQHEPVP